jgi:integrase/recombinase XerD
MMYGAALRTLEAMSLTNSDVDLLNSVLTVRDSKFFKSRLVPIGPMTTQILTSYVNRCSAFGGSHRDDAPFFSGRNSKKVNICTLDGAFQQLREYAGLRRVDGSRCQPRLHDLRQHADCLVMPTWYCKPAPVALEAHWESA